MFFVDVNVVGKWSDTVPGCTVSRVELLGWICQVHRANLVDDDETRRYLFRRIARSGALTVGQLSQLFHVSRQRMYIWLLQQGIDKPEAESRKQGSFKPETAEMLLAVVKTLTSRGPEGLTVTMLENLPKCGSPGIIEHLTGVDYRTYNPLNPYSTTTTTLKVS